MHIPVVGNIATGKTTIAKKLSTFLAFSYYPEPEGIFNLQFHRDMKRWAFHNQMDYLLGTMQYELMIGRSGKPSVQDRCSSEVLKVFSRALFNMGYLNESELSCLDGLYDIAQSLCLPKPSFLIYLKAPIDVLLKRLVHRERHQDLLIDREMITSLQSLYDEWIEDLEQTGVLQWNTCSHDVESNDKNLHLLAQKVSAMLTI